MYLKSGLTREDGICGLIREVAIGVCGLIREVAIGICDLIREVTKYKLFVFTCH